MKQARAHRDARRGTTVLEQRGVEEINTESDWYFWLYGSRLDWLQRYEDLDKVRERVPDAAPEVAGPQDLRVGSRLDLPIIERHDPELAALGQRSEHLLAVGRAAMGRDVVEAAGVVDDVVRGARQLIAQDVAHRERRSGWHRLLAEAD